MSCVSRALIPPRWPTDRVRLLRAAFRRKILAPRLLYETPAQSRKWLAVHRRWSPAAAARGRRLYRAAFRGIARAAPRAVRVISLGCGSGAKDRDLLEALRHRGVHAAYCPCDVSPSLVGKAAAACRRAALGGCRPLVADLAAPLAPAAFARRLNRLPFPRTPRIVLFLGMLPNFDPSRARRILRAVLRRGDLLVVSANLLPPGKLAERRVMTQYDNRETRAWLLELPRALGWPAHAETLSFRWGRASERRGPRRIEVRYRAAKHPPRLIFFSNRHTRTQLRAFVRALGARAPRLLTTTAGDEGVAWGNVRARGAARRRPSERLSRAAREALKLSIKARRRRASARSEPFRRA